MFVPGLPDWNFGVFGELELPWSAVGRALALPGRIRLVWTAKNALEDLVLRRGGDGHQDAILLDEPVDDVLPRRLIQPARVMTRSCHG